MKLTCIARLLLVFVAVAPLVACGGAASIVDCAPQTVTQCTPTDGAGAGCNVLNSPIDGAPIVRVVCSGTDARINCYPAEHQICVDACAGAGGIACK